MFTLPKPTYVTLTNLNPRVEKHGDENVSAIDLTITHDAPNTVLDLFEPGLLDAFYRAAEDGDDGLEFEISPKPALRFNRLGPQKLTTKLVGYRFAIEYGLCDLVSDDRGGIVLGSIDVSKFVLDLKEGGSVSLKYLVQANSGLTEQIIGKLAMLIGQEVRVTLTPPEVKAEEGEPSLVLPGMDEETKPLTAEDVFIGGVVPGEAAAVH